MANGGSGRDSGMIGKRSLAIDSVIGEIRGRGWPVEWSRPLEARDVGLVLAGLALAHRLTQTT